MIASSKESCARLEQLGIIRRTMSASCYFFYISWDLNMVLMWSFCPLRRGFECGEQMLAVFFSLSCFRSDANVLVSQFNLVVVVFTSN